ncbi:hypothetical protein PPSIR1_06536 [Plesiocystis pacifica SIR-1]|uniref:Uncharacterized protein n=1 Tax=Plesiocystis pacifica SIR-1 TaxID=391625 RepID=A6GHG1_9BACT|nr:hypothetical protein [Plesiocystis pacifica]EDM74678.1 hypothetical protein PPSIR1_06536 [Plesiocystis pacifica SIR-1]
MTNGEFQIPANVWFSETPETPSLDPTAFADIKFALVPGESSIGPSVALVGAYSLGWPYVELYGSELYLVFKVVAISASTGAVYFADLNEVVPFRQEDAIIVQMSDAEANRSGPARDIPAEAGYFNVDLARYLGLPPTSDHYQVFVWLDDLVTRVQTVQVPSNEARQAVDPSVFQVPSSGLLTIEQSVHSPTPQPGEIRTDLDFSQGRSYRVYAALPPGALDAPPTGGAPGTPAVTVLAFNRQTQSLMWATDTGAYASMVKAGTGFYDFDPFAILPKPNPAANVYVVTVVGNLDNDVLPIFVDYQ